jgi:hypothetical protein
MADVVYATEVKVDIEGDTHFPKLNPLEWTREVLHSFSKNEKNENLTLCLVKSKALASLFGGNVKLVFENIFYL